MRDTETQINRQTDEQTHVDTQAKTDQPKKQSPDMTQTVKKKVAETGLWSLVRYEWWEVYSMGVTRR